MNIEISTAWLLVVAALAGVFAGGWLHRIWPWTEMLRKRN